MTITITSFDYHIECPGESPDIFVNLTFKVDSKEELVKEFFIAHCFGFQIPDEWGIFDPMLRYLEKFDTFWFRSQTSDNPVTRAAVDELSWYHRKGRLRADSLSSKENYFFLLLQTIRRFEV